MMLFAMKLRNAVVYVCWNYKPPARREARSAPPKTCNTGRLPKQESVRIDDIHVSGIMMIHEIHLSNFTSQISFVKFICQISRVKFDLSNSFVKFH